MLHTSYIELSKEALNNNIGFLKKRIGSHARYSMVVKANAYGHGIEQLLPLVEDCGVDHYAVFSVAEAMRVHEIKKESCELMIMGFIDDDYLEWAIERDVSFYVFTIERLRRVIEVSQKTNKPARIHIELETGMYRTGFCEDQLEEVSALLKKHSSKLVLEGICSHMAGAESIVNYRRMLEQIDAFNKLCNWFHAEGFQPRYRHLACSAGVLNYPDSVMDMARVGIASYGFWPSEEMKMMHLKEVGFDENPLQRVLSWKSVIMSVNKVPKGKYVSYGKSFMTNRKSKIATVPVGYGYGFSRTLSNNGHVLVDGKRVRVIGSVNMNMAVLDVTDIENVKAGDSVVLIGEQGGESISVESFSDMNNSMNYELLTRLPHHIPRREA